MGVAPDRRELAVTGRIESQVSAGGDGWPPETSSTPPGSPPVEAAYESTPVALSDGCDPCPGVAVPRRGLHHRRIPDLAGGHQQWPRFGPRGGRRRHHVVHRQSVGAFAVATANVGGSGEITARADTGATTLPLALALCRTDPATGSCASPAGPAVTTSVIVGETPTFGIFVSAAAQVPFDPANHRIFVRFKDATGITRGSTSVAVRTQ